ncbi:methylated-DNA--[protein]-cysteine S-methyltransferase [Helicobacter aurati]|uniref:Methylated-DNA--protein-cysteine methyltransferase n=1 Tax=Helicobacter aurati TaxID=137778 RepID=A0A3D8J9C8_9HELI|nr:methylated-DNA--[protein]-cysteine S-methyltransferase [Helicobacter aurati]RDU73785.1 methylated-DNA--[protein]-cysteine S-methyltransferase [Helicobacter aurati]
MFYQTYQSPLGMILMLGNTKNLIGLYFQTQQDFHKLQSQHSKKELPIFTQTIQWLDLYFSGKTPSFMPPLQLDSTNFRLHVWQILQTIPKGETTTYKQIAKIITKEKGLAKMSAQAVGGAVGANPIAIIIPCHRVIGANNNLVGYAGGITIKKKLLELEGLDISILKNP